MNEHYPFKLSKLDYSYDALEPYIDSKTVYLHHDMHLKAYIDNLNKALAGYTKYQNLDLISLIKLSRYFPVTMQTKIINNAGGVYNHLLYFDILKKDVMVPLDFKGKIEENFGSFEKFIEKFKTCAMDVFGSGYTFVALDKSLKMHIINTKNQDTPLCMGMYPIMLIDVWEHAYYLKYQNRKKEYVENFIKIINWEKVNSYYKYYKEIMS